MAEFKVSNSGSASLFKNLFLERLTRTNFITPVVLFFVVGASATVFSLVNKYTSIELTLLLFCLGVFFFTFIEYVMHRFVFHFKANTKRQKEFKYKIHGVHHHYPKDKDRLVMPPVMSIGLAIIFFFIFKIIAGNYSFAFWGGFLSGYSLYLIIHYAVHRYRQPKNFLKVLWKHHSLHHYRSDDSAFGVSNPLWDYLFGTMPPSKSIRKEEMENLPDLLNKSN